MVTAFRLYGTACGRSAPPPWLPWLSAAAAWLAPLPGRDPAAAALQIEPPRSGHRTLLRAAAVRDSSGWTPFALDAANRATTMRLEPTSPWLARLDVRSLRPRPAPWHVNVSYRNQELAALEPSTDYVLTFRARSTTRRAIALDLARPHTPYRNLGLLRDVAIDPVGRDYRVHFRTADSLPGRDEPGSTGFWLTMGAGQARGTVWLGEVSLARAPRTKFAGAALALTGFRPEECWTGGSPNGLAAHTPAGLELRAPAGGTAFVSKEQPLDLSGPEWDMVLRVHAAEPSRVGRVVVFARPGATPDGGYAFQSFSGLERGWTRIVIPRERFRRYAWQGPFSWSDVRELAVRLEANGNGPTRVTLGSLSIEPAADPATLPPVISRLGIEHGLGGMVRIRCEIDRPALCRLEFGLAPGYGGTRAGSGPATVHAFELAGLAPGRVYHARLRARSANGTSSSTGDFTFAVDPAGAPTTLAAGTGPVPIGLFATTTPWDLAHAAISDFDSFSSYRFHSCSDTDDEARAYLDAAARAGRRALMGFCIESVARGDTARVLPRVRRLSGHPGLLGWFLYDEPEARDVDPSALAHVRDAIRSQDPAHPVFVVLSAPAALRTYREAADVAIVDRYPIPHGPIDDVVPLLRAAGESGRPFHWTFQSYATDVHRWPGLPPGPARYPTFEEMRALAWLGVVYGARGCWSYAYSYLNETPGSEWQWAGLLAVAREMRLHEWLLAAPALVDTSVEVLSGGAVHAGLRDVGGRPYLIVVNAARTPARPRLHLRGRTARAVRDVAAGHTRSVPASQIPLEMNGYGVRVFELIE